MKKVVIALVVVFLGFWMFTDPRGLADAAGGAGGQIAAWTGDFFSALIRFVGELG
ncbi:MULTISPECIES: hypothetical protein [Nocardioides]|uniref:Uncharacterized protein n=1 Tax=Nocardioides kribbensis TaxID=305517 RepID=A0ABV1NWG2_9ACTN|nr:MULTISPECIES: hypothetical protein [Nocardioides]MBJ7528964.1 hypothetical protein [Nocardioides sp.]MCM3515628.1 hypothetical protein [Nocardioides sp. P86]